MPRKLTPAQQRKKDKTTAKVKVTKNADIARQILADKKYPIFKEQLRKGARIAGISKATLLRQKGGDAVEKMIELRILQFKEDFFEGFADCPQDWLAAERKMKAEEKVEKRYETA